MSRIRWWGLAVVLACVGLPLFASARAEADPSLPAGFEDNLLVTGFDQPTAFAYTPDGRTFVAEKSGRLRVVSAGGVLDPTPVIDISDHVNSRVDRGLLGLAVDKDYATNHYVYLLYTYEHNALDPDGVKVSKLTRIEVAGNNSVVDPPGPTGPETTILGKSPLTTCPAPSNAVDCIPADYVWHTIGTVRSDPVDGTLWVGTGDGQMSLNFQAKTLLVQNEETYRGKIMHIDRDGNGLPGHAFCPSDDDLTNVCTKIHAKGFRNPFRFSLRPGRSPIVGDVGADDREEVDLARKGGNYGWPCYEGDVRNGIHESAPACQALYAQQNTPNAADPPLWSYPHGSSGNAVAGGPVYTGTNYPAPYRGDIFVADFAASWVKRLDVDANDQLQGVEDFASWPFDNSDPNQPYPTVSPVDIQMSPQGDIVYLDIGYTANQNGLHRFNWTPGNATPVARATGSPLAGPAPLTVSFDARASTDTDGDALTYTWNFGDGQTGTGEQVSHAYGRTSGSYTATVTVSDGRGGTSSTTVGPITPGNLAPAATVDAPATFRYGSSVTLHGTGLDLEDGELGDGRLKWRVFQQHGSHTHQFGDFTGPHATFNAGTDHDADSFFVARLTAMDARGATDVKTVEIRPETVQLTLTSEPPGAPLTYGTAPIATPHTRTAAIGFDATIGAPAAFDLGALPHDFASWSDGGVRQHQISIPEDDTTLIARYEPRPAEAVAPPPGGGGSGVPAPPAAKLVELRLSRAGVRLSDSGLLSIKLANAGSATSVGDLKLTTTRRVRVGRARAKRIKLADAGFIVAPRGSRTLRVRLSKAHRKLVAKLRMVPVDVTWRAQERGGGRKASGRSASRLLAPKRQRR